MCVPVIADIEDQDSRQSGTLHVLTVFPTFILPDFYFTIPIKKWYTAVGGKRYLHAAVSFFVENNKNQRSNGGELHG